jgi:hypothetical protein
MAIEMHPDLLLVKNNIFDPLQLNLDEYFQESESTEYSACGFSLAQKLTRFRTAKVTPKKVGQFVTLWKRSHTGIIPFDESDNLDFVMILANTGILKGLFVFPKALLMEKKIFSTSKIEGKRGFRVYPPWAITENKQAKQTQAWQVRYFIALKEDDPIDQNLLIKLGFRN